MTGRLEGKVALITGASRGIGRATALLFAKEGARVCVNYCKSAGDAADLAAELKKGGHDAISLGADVSNAAQVKKMVDDVIGRFGTVDILVNNAGVAHGADLFSIRTEDLDLMLGVNLRGTLYCVQSVAEQMAKKRSGKIVNIASIAALGTAFSGTTAYAATKAGVVILTKRFALELGKHGITVNCVAPGFVHTEMSEGDRSPEEFDRLVKEMKGKAMLGRIGEPIDIANAVLFFASEESSFVTGQVLVVDGGRMDFLTHSV